MTVEANYPEASRLMVTEHINEHLDEFELEHAVVFGDTCVISFSLTEKNWRAFIIVDPMKETFFVVSYNSSDGRRTLDVYEKTDSVSTSDRAAYVTAVQFE